MGLQSAVCCLHNYSSVSTILFSPNQRLFSRVSIPKKSAGFALLRNQTPGFLNLCSTSYMVSGLKKRVKEHLVPSLSKGLVVRASGDNQEGKSNILGQKNAGVDEVEAFRGKAGSVSFFGVTHQMVEEGRLVSAPFNESSGSVLWVVAPVALILSLVLPQLFFDFAIDGLINDEILSEVVASFTSEIIFYIGLAVFLYITDKTQRPYLQYSPKRWSLITGLKGYLSSAFFTMGFKVVAPLVVVYVTWPVLGLPALISVAPFLCGCVAQYAFEKLLQKTGSSCWPLVPIIFEVYRLYQLSKAAHFIEKLMFAMRGVPVSPAVLEKNGALVAMILTFQALGMICLWSMLTFLQRLFPSRPVAENY